MPACYPIYRVVKGKLVFAVVLGQAQGDTGRLEGIKHDTANSPQRLERLHTAYNAENKAQKVAFSLPWAGPRHAADGRNGPLTAFPALGRLLIDVSLRKVRV